MVEPGAGLEDIERLTDEVHRRYQADDYTAAARMLPALVTITDVVHRRRPPGHLHTASTVLEHPRDFAGRRSERADASDRLNRAQYLADALGEDANHGWTAFGTTNVAIHRISVSAELGDAETAIRFAEQIDTSNLPAKKNSGQDTTPSSSDPIVSSSTTSPSVIRNARLPMASATKMAPPLP